MDAKTEGYLRTYPEWLRNVSGSDHRRYDSIVEIKVWRGDVRIESQRGYVESLSNKRAKMDPFVRSFSLEKGRESTPNIQKSLYIHDLGCSRMKPPKRDGGRRAVGFCIKGDSREGSEGRTGIYYSERDSTTCAGLGVSSRKASPEY